VDAKRKYSFCLHAGLPYEMKAIVTDELIPKIVKEYERPYILHKTILTYGQGESIVAQRIEEWENNLPVICKISLFTQSGSSAICV
jgi:nicotinamide-nucleotide amidase